ncbi:MAG TPA: glycosyltransferase family 2 protein [Bryobacteraceae bacterium]|nr:glycosyltransferase family 2 protein [Bryobacteraceae bacterium]
MFWFWLFVAPALALAIFALRGERARARWVAEQLADESDDPTPPATVIVSLSGPEERLRENLAALTAQDYPNYELLVTARTAFDIPPNSLPHRVTVVLGGAQDEKASPKIQNLLAGVRAARKRSEILAFADAGGQVSANWLRALAAQLGDAEVGASTAYRFFVPDPPDFWSLVRSVWDAPVAGLLGPGDNPFAWCGSLAIRKERFFELQIPGAWRLAASEDGALTHAIHKARLKIAFAPGAMLAYAGRTGARPFFAGAQHQMAMARVYFPRLWWSALIAHVFYCGGMAAAVTASIRGSRGAEWALVVQLGLGMLKGVNRATLAKAEFPDCEAWFKRHAWVHSLWVPLGTWLWLCVLLSSVFNRMDESGARRQSIPSASQARA